ncbi:MAG: hypothetical protein ACYC27_17615 [Armatimonadota bacterium]
MQRSIFYNNSGKAVSILIIILLIGTVGLAAYYNSSKQAGKTEDLPLRMSLNVSERKTESESSWQILISSTKRECAKDSSGCTVDFDIYHEHDDKSYGILVLAWQESEYEIDLYRYDPLNRVWVDSPRHEINGLNHIDTALTSKKWKLPEDTINQWIKEADDFMKNKYGEGRVSE